MNDEGYKYGYFLCERDLMMYIKRIFFFLAAIMVVNYLKAEIPRHLLMQLDTSIVALKERGYSEEYIARQMLECLKNMKEVRQDEALLKKTQHFLRKYKKPITAGLFLAVLTGVAALLYMQTENSEVPPANDPPVQDPNRRAPRRRARRGLGVEPSSETNDFGSFFETNPNQNNVSLRRSRRLQ